MSYSIHITAAAERDMMNASDYIDFTLKNQKAADDLLDEAETKINELSEFPEKFPLVEDTVLASWGVRFVIVKNYLAFYVISEKQKIVHIVRFLYQKSDWMTILRSGFSVQI